MALEGIVKDNIHRFVISRRLITTIHEFRRDNIFGDGDKYKDDHVTAEIDAKLTCSGCPVQYEGTVNGKNFYYRDRHGSWRFEVYDGEIFEGDPIFRKEGGSIDCIGYEGFIFAEKKIYKNALKFAKKFKQYMPKINEENSEKTVDKNDPS